MAIKKIKLPGMAQPVDIGTTWANVSGKPDLITSDSLTAAINAAFATNDAMVFKGTIGADGTVTQLPATHEAGWTYKVISNGSLAGQTCEIGDMIVCIKDGTVANANDWTVIQTNVDGAVTGPASSTAGHIATFTGTTGKVIQDSGFTIATSVPANAVFTDTTYENKTAASGGTDVSLVTTGDKYNWNNKGTYSKPSGGIPASDLASDIITKLDEAKVKQTVKSDNVNYKILMGATSSPISGTAYEAVYDTNITINPSTDTLNIGNIHLSGNYNSLLTGIEIRASVDNGSSATPRYIPGKWVFNTGIAPVDGNIYTIRILSTLTSAGIYISVFGTNDADYHPLCAAGANRITTQFAAGTTLQVVYESTSSATVYPLDPTTNNTTTVTGIFRVINYYDTNTNTLQRTYASSSANKLPIGGIASNTSMAVPTHTSSYKDLYAGIPATTANRPTVQLSTGLIDVPAGVDLGVSKSKLGKLGLYNTSNTNKTTIQSGTPSSAVTLTLPASTGTLALTSEIVKPTMKSISFTTTWTGSGPYTQTVTVSGYTITSNSKVDLQPDEATITQLIEDGVQTLYISNTNGTLTAIATGAAPTTAMTIQCTVTEVNV